MNKAINHIDPREFRNALGQFATGITVITAIDEQGGQIGFTANSFNSVSMDPPLVLWSLAHDSMLHERFLSADRYAINVLSEEQVEVSNQFASPVTDRFAGVDYYLSDTGLPLIRGTLARFECRSRHHYEGGDHTIFVGEVESFDYDRNREPLLYHQGRYTKIADDD